MNDDQGLFPLAVSILCRPTLDEILESYKRLYGKVGPDKEEKESEDEEDEEEDEGEVVEEGEAEEGE